MTKINLGISRTIHPNREIFEVYAVPKVPNRPFWTVIRVDSYLNSLYFGRLRSKIGIRSELKSPKPQADFSKVSCKMLKTSIY